MEVKTVILSVLILSLMMAPLQVDAKICCPSSTARNFYNVCRYGRGSRSTCLSLSGCKFVEGSTCPWPIGYGQLTQELSGRTEYCKLGCVSSVCNVMSALKNSDGAVAHCTNSCSAFCAKGSTDALAISSSE